MKTKMLATMLIVILAGYPAIAFGSNQGSPAVYTVNYVISSDTTYNVNIANPQTMMNFSGNRETSGIEPDGQDRAAAVPVAWATVVNGGSSVNQSFSVKLNAANPPSIVLKISNNPDMSGAIIASITAQTPAGWERVQPSGLVELYATADFNGAPDGTTSRTLTISSGLPSTPTAPPGTCYDEFGDPIPC